jgi:cell division protein FtsW
MRLAWPLAERIVTVVVILMAFGAVAVFSASANIDQELDLQRFYDFQALRQIAFFLLATAMIYGVSLVDYRLLRFRKPYYKCPIVHLFAASIILLVAVLIPGFGTEVNSARRWLRLPLGAVTVGFQPSELAKWTTVFLLAGFCDYFNSSAGLSWRRFILACAIAGVVVALVLVEDFGTAALIALLAALMLLIGGACWRHLLTPLPIAAAAFYLAVVGSPGRLERLCAFANPGKWADSVAYQANQSLIAIGSGGPWGKGLGMGTCKYGHLPEDTTDFVFAVVGEELGLIGTAGIIALFAAFVWLGVLVVRRCSDRFGQILAAGIVLAIGIQAAVNIGVVTVVLPTKGMPLPFVSAGGTSMLLTAAAVGILVNIAGNKPEVTCQGDGR